MRRILAPFAACILLLVIVTSSARAVASVAPLQPPIPNYSFERVDPLDHTQAASWLRDGDVGDHQVWLDSHTSFEGRRSLELIHGTTGQYDRPSVTSAMFPLGNPHRTLYTAQVYAKGDGDDRTLNIQVDFYDDAGRALYTSPITPFTVQSSWHPYRLQAVAPPLTRKVTLWLEEGDLSIQASAIWVDAVSLKPSR